MFTFGPDSRGFLVAIERARGHYSERAPLARHSCEHVVRTSFSVGIFSDGSINVTSATIHAQAHLLARCFAANAVLQMDYKLERPDQCVLEVFDYLALRRRQCRKAVLPLLSRRLLQVLPRDLHVMLARMVWESRRADCWAGPEEASLFHAVPVYKQAKTLK